MFGEQRITASRAKGEYGLDDRDLSGKKGARGGMGGRPGRATRGFQGQGQGGRPGMR